MDSFSLVHSASMTRIQVPEGVLRATDAARQLGMPTKELLRLALERKIRYVMVEGLVHFPIEALEEYRAQVS
jgi:hypothetical protein